jgi:two-component system LytT family response regulator
MIKAIAIDDEPLALKVLEDHAAKLDFIRIEKFFSEPLQGLEYVKQQNISAIFLDIKMKDISGIDLADIIHKDTCIIFTTAYPEYAVKGFDLNALDYLLKPISFTRFLKACHKLKEQIEEKQIANPLFLKEGNEIIKLNPSEILFVEAVGNYLKVYTSAGVLLHRETLKEFIDKLPVSDFVRIHKSYIINLQKVSRIQPFQLTVDNKKIPVSPNYKNDLWKKFGIK